MADMLSEWLKAAANGCKVTRGTYDLPLGDQNLKQGAWMGAKKLWFSGLLPVNKQQNSWLILHFWNKNGKCWSSPVGLKNTSANER